MFTPQYSLLNVSPGTGISLGKVEMKQTQTSPMCIVSARMVGMPDRQKLAKENFAR